MGATPVPASQSDVHRPEKRQKTGDSISTPTGLALNELPTAPHAAGRRPTLPDMTTSDIVRLRVWDPLPSPNPKYIDFNIHVDAIKTKTKMLDYFLIHPQERNGKTTAAVDANPFSIRQIGVGPDVFKCFIEWAYTGRYEVSLDAYISGLLEAGFGTKPLVIHEGLKLKVHLEVYQCAKCLGCTELGKLAFKCLYEILKAGVPLDREENDAGLAETLVMVFNPKDESQGLIGIREMLIAYLGSRLPEAMRAPHITGVISILPSLSLALLRRVHVGKEFDAVLPTIEDDLF